MSLEPVATEEEVAAYEESSALVEEELEEYRRRRTVKLSGWTQPGLFISHYNIERNNNLVTAYAWPEMTITSLFL